MKELSFYLPLIFLNYVLSFWIALSYPCQKIRDIGERLFIKWGIMVPFWTCRTCVGAWIAIAVTIIAGGSFLDYFVIYGSAVFLATQERKINVGGK